VLLLLARLDHYEIITGKRQLNSGRETHNEDMRFVVGQKERTRKTRGREKKKLFKGPVLTSSSYAVF
jgi:hypothetical protein